MMSYFPASMDRMTRWITGSALVLLSAVVVMAWRVGSPRHAAVVTGINVLLVSLSYAFAPRGYRVEGDRLQVIRLIGRVDLPLREIQEARALEYRDLGFVMRTFGNGGLFGFYGRYYASGIGHHHWYASRRSGLVLLRFSERTVIISPDEPERFLAALPQPALVAG